MESTKEITTVARPTPAEQHGGRRHKVRDPSGNIIPSTGTELYTSLLLTEGEGQLFGRKDSEPRKASVM